MHGSITSTASSAEQRGKAASLSQTRAASDLDPLAWFLVMLCLSRVAENCLSLCGCARVGHWGFSCIHNRLISFTLLGRLVSLVSWIGKLSQVTLTPQGLFTSDNCATCG